MILFLCYITNERLFLFMKKLVSFIMTLFLSVFLSFPLTPIEPSLPPEPSQNSVVHIGKIDPPSHPASQTNLPDVIIDEH